MCFPVSSPPGMVAGCIPWGGQLCGIYPFAPGLRCLCPVPPPPPSLHLWCSSLGEWFCSPSVWGSSYLSSPSGFVCGLNSWHRKLAGVLPLPSNSASRRVVTAPFFTSIVFGGSPQTWFFWCSVLKGSQDLWREWGIPWWMRWSLWWRHGAIIVSFTLSSPSFICCADWRLHISLVNPGTLT